MKNQYILIIIIILVILSLAISFFKYSLRIFILFLIFIIFGFFLADRMRKKNIDIEEKLDKFWYKNKPKVVVSFTTIPSRSKYIPDILSKLSKQTVKPDTIYVNIPYYSKRLKTRYTIPFDTTTLDDNVVIVRCEDYGPATKLLGAIEYEDNPDTIFVTIDDDQDYHKDMLKTIIINSIKNPNSVVSFSALESNLMTSICFFNNKKSPDAFFIEGFAGVSYRRKFITKDMIEYFENNLSDDCFLSDDLVISSWMEILGIERIQLCGYDNTRATDTKIDRNNALHRLNRNQVYNKCLKEMNMLIKRNGVPHE